MYDQKKLAPAASDAALAVARAVLKREGVTAAEAILGCQTDLMLAEGLDGADRTDEHFREHGASLKACDAYYAARSAAEAEIANLDPANAGFKVLFSLAD